MAELLRDPVLYPNWVWTLGVGLIVVALSWGIGLLVAYLRSKVFQPAQIHSLNEVRRMRYERLLDEVEQDFAAGNLSARDAHLSISALIRAAASERMGTNVESVSVRMARESYGVWPLFADALAWCEEPSFGLGEAGVAGQAMDASSVEAVENGLGFARQVVRQ